MPVILVSILFLMSCNAVKEDRRYCPCTLSVVLEGLPEYPAWVYVNGTLAGEAAADTTLAVWVDRGPEADVAVFAGAPPGRTAPSGSLMALPARPSTRSSAEPTAPERPGASR